MTAPRLELSRLPDWPRWLSDEFAAAYVGVSASTFREEVKRNVWPQPHRRGATGRLPRWDRHELDLASDRMSNPSLSAKQRMLNKAIQP